MKEAFKKFGAKCSSIWNKFKKWLGKANWKLIYDKVTTGILILLMASPIIILAYIILWFVIPK